jgi:uncharacterized protein
MHIFAISDLHLSGFKPKPMDIFGENWQGHWDKIRADWQQNVSDDDIVLIPGDISWAMKLSEATVDIEQICALNGTKILCKGNHDYWWSSLSKVNAILTNNTFILQNNAVEIGDYVFAGSRGWVMPNGETPLDAQDEKIYLREIERVKMSLNAIKDKSKHIIVMMHFPPIYDNNMDNAFIDLLVEFGVRHVVYGHLHDASAYQSFNGTYKDIVFQNVSCDYLDFKLHRLF